MAKEDGSGEVLAFFPCARVTSVGSAKQLMRPLQLLVVNMCRLLLIAATRS